LIVVDYLQLMHAPSTKNDNRQQEVASISRALKALARDLQIPVLALSQLSRLPEQRAGSGKKNQMPKLSDLRESGAIEQDADMVLFIHRNFENEPGRPDLAKVRIAKQRNGPTGDFELFFWGEHTRFGDVSHSAHGPQGQ
jgi:replicative DNA helicase